MLRYQGILPGSLDFEDYVQEGMIAWLEGRNMLHGMLDAFRKASALSVYAYKVKKTQATKIVELDDSHSPEDYHDELDALIDTKTMAQKVLNRIYSIADEQKQFALVAYVYLGMSLREIAEVFGKSYEWVRMYLIDEELKKIKEEFSCLKD